MPFPNSIYHILNGAMTPPPTPPSPPLSSNEMYRAGRRVSNQSRRPASIDPTSSKAITTRYFPTRKQAKFSSSFTIFLSRVDLKILRPTRDMGGKKGQEGWVCPFVHAIKRRNGEKKKRDSRVLTLEFLQLSRIVSTCLASLALVPHQQSKHEKRSPKRNLCPGDSFRPVFCSRD